MTSISLAFLVLILGIFVKILYDQRQKRKKESPTQKGGLVPEGTVLHGPDTAFSTRDISTETVYDPFPGEFMNEEAWLEWQAKKRRDSSSLKHLGL